MYCRVMFRLISSAVIALCANQSSLAQIDYSTSYIQAPLWNSINSSNPIMTEDFSSESIYNKSAPTAAPQSLSFTPNAGQRKKNVADYISRVAKIAPTYAPQLAAEFADGQIFTHYGQLMDSVGLSANDVGDNLAVWWITAWEASMGRPVDTPPAAFAKVKTQVSRILSEKKLLVMSNADKQRYADSLTIQSMILANQIEQAKTNPDIAQKLATGIKAGAKKMGFDLEAMTLSKDGFVPTKPKARNPK